MKTLLTYAIALGALIAFTSESVAKDKVQKVGDDWKITISPGPTASSSEKPGNLKVDPSEYQRIYNSIPFNRAEYRANPSYRHDAAMEILFGEMRDTTIIRNAPRATRRNNHVYPSSASAALFRYNTNLSPYGINYFLPAWNARGLYRQSVRRSFVRP